MINKEIQVKLIFFVVVLMTGLLSCYNSTATHPDDRTKIKDSNAITANNRSADTNVNQDLTNIYKEFIESYKKPCIIDSIFVFGTDSFKMHLKHYCLMDSAINVPVKYVHIYKLDSFVTHNYITEVKIDKNSKTIFQTTIYKKNFDTLLYPQLKEYGVLFCPDLKLSGDTFELDYSVSIPLTDIGVGIAMIINRNGKVIYKKH